MIDVLEKKNIELDYVERVMLKKALDLKIKENKDLIQSVMNNELDDVSIHIMNVATSDIEWFNKLKEKLD